MADATKRMTARGYAEHRNVSPPSVLAAIRSGRIAAAASKVGSRWQIEVEKADELWAANTHVAPRNNKRMEPSSPEDREQLARESLGEAPRDDEDFQAARTRHERAKADLAEIKREEEAGRLVDAQSQQREGFKVAQLVRDALLQVADRLAPELCAEMDQSKVHAMLRREIIDCLRHLCEIEGGVEIQRGGES